MKDYPVLLKPLRSLQASMLPRSQPQSSPLSITTWVVFQPTTKLRLLKWLTVNKLSFQDFWLVVKQVLPQSMEPTDWAPTHCSIWLFSEEPLPWSPKKSINQAKLSQSCQRTLVRNQLLESKILKTARVQFQPQKSERKCKETCKETQLCTEFKKLSKKDATKLTKFIKHIMTLLSLTRVQFGTLT